MRHYSLRPGPEPQPDGSDVPAHERHRARAEMARRAREERRREAEPSVREEYERQARERALDEVAYPYSADPMGPDGMPVWGLLGHDSRVCYEPDSDALYEPDPVRLVGDEAAHDARYGEQVIHGDIDLLDRHNREAFSVGLDARPHEYDLHAHLDALDRSNGLLGWL